MSDRLSEIVERDPRYALEAYLFVFEALPVAQRMVAKERHVSGRELLDGIRALARERYGLMARHVLNSWGIYSTDDFGAIVFNLVNAELLSRTEDDTVDEFHDVYDFEEAFHKGYRIGQASESQDGKAGSP